MKQVVKSNGVYPLNHKHSASRSVLYAAGTPDQAILSLVTYVGSSKVPLKDTAGDDIVLEVGSQIEVNHGTEQRIYVDINGAGSNTDLTVICQPLR